MAKKKNDGSLIIILLVLVGLTIFLPFLIISFISYNKLKNSYLHAETTPQVVDTDRLIPCFIGICSFLAVAAFIIVSNFSEWNKTGSSGALSIVVSLFLLALACGYYTARHMAVLYMGVFVNTQEGLLFMPYDMQSYTLGDYFGFRFLHDLCHIDSIHLSDINKMTRGGRGKELYVHGEFGSRRIRMSNKQKRDECLAMIQKLSGKKGLLTGELESL